MNLDILFFEAGHSYFIGWYSVESGSFSLHGIDVISGLVGHRVGSVGNIGFEWYVSSIEILKINKVA